MTDLISQIDRALDAGNIAAAAQIAEQALQQGSKDPVVYNLAAWRYEEDGRFAEAEALIRDAQLRAPNDPTLFVALGAIKRKQGQLREAIEAIEHALDLDPSFAAAWYERGATFEKGGALADAVADYRHAAQLDPHDAAAHAALASVLARQGDGLEATTHAHTALSLEPDNLLAHNALAHVAIEQRQPDEVIRLLEPHIVDLTDTRELLISTLTLLGDGYEAASRFDDAFRAYARAQDLFATIHSQRLEDGAGDSLGFLDRVTISLGAVDPGRLADQAALTGAAGPAMCHVVLTGHPRSGTTLAENILASLPNALAIEERPTLKLADQEYLSQPDGLTKLAALDQAGLQRLRDDYWSRAERAADQSLEGKLFIDMDPFKGSRLPVIAPLFPNSKVVITRRDPRDVVWSCFHTNFAFNAGTMAFTTLERTAQHYAKTWSIIEAALETLPINWFDLRYETLIADFDHTTQALCSFLGVPWSDDVRRFDRTAQRRGVTTASATQVRQGLYDGSGGWRRYEAYLATVAPILDPWVERFGYA
jgi:tetratricopeptide (TPR) repeat protein